MADCGGPEHRPEPCKKKYPARRSGGTDRAYRGPGTHTGGRSDPAGMGQELLEALGRLLPEERVLFYRKYYYLQSTARIAAELGMTERAVEGKLYRLKRRLRKLLGGEQDG